MFSYIFFPAIISGSIASEERYFIYSNRYTIWKSSLDGSRRQVLVTDRSRTIDYNYRYFIESLYNFTDYNTTTYSQT